jgi:Protein of unknown function (DUF3379)
MTCLEFRKQLLAAPRALTAEMTDHRAQCTECAAFAARIEQMESALAAAVLVDPPEGLANRVLLRRSLADTRTSTSGRTPDRRRFIALAASVTVAATGLGAFLFWRRAIGPGGDEGLARELVAHILGAHPPGLGATTGSVSETEVITLLARAGFAAHASIGKIGNAWPCTFRDKPIAHFVLDVDARPVTGLVLPQRLVEQSLPYTGPDLSGVIAPCAQGTLALLSEGDGDFDALVAHLQNVIVAV